MDKVVKQVDTCTNSVDKPAFLDYLAAHVAECEGLAPVAGTETDDRYSVCPTCGQVIGRVAQAEAQPRHVPYRCPVCNGTGQHTMMHYIDACHACGGTGVLWG